MGLFGPSKEKVDSAIEHNIKSALEEISQEVGIKSFNKFRSSNPGVLYGFCYGIATHTWEDMNKKKPDWRVYGDLFPLVHFITGIDSKHGDDDYHRIGWNYQQGILWNKDYRWENLKVITDKINSSK